MHALLDPTAHPVIAHRGAAADAPENTLTAFELALARGADALELDVRLTADEVPVVLHDPTLDRTTDRPGDVARLPLRVVQAADAGYWFTSDGGRSFPWRGRGVYVPTLATILERFTETPLLIELKTAAAAPAARRVLERHAAQGRVVVAAFDAAAVAGFPHPAFRRAGSRGAIARRWVVSLVGARIPRAGFDVLAVPERWRGLPIPTRRFVRSAGCPVHVWTVNDPAAARRHWARGVAGIVTDLPALLRAARDRPRALDAPPSAP